MVPGSGSIFFCIRVWSCGMISSVQSSGPKD